MKIAGYDTHPAANIFPLLGDHELAELADDIRAHGLRNPVIVIGSQILDGRNRALACERVGVEPRFVQFEGDDPLAFVLSENLHRRHLNESQRAMVAARVATLKNGLRSDRVAASIDAATQDEAAAQLNIGRASVQRARTVLTHAIPEVVQAVDGGRLAVSAAAELAKLPTEKQAEILDRAGDNTRDVRRMARKESAKSSRDERPAEAPAPTVARDPSVAARDEEIIAVFLGEGGESVGETASVLRLPRAQVQDAVYRAGLSRAQKAARDPLRGFIENASASEFGWKLSLTSDVWAQANDDQRSEALAALEGAIAAGRKLANKIAKMTKKTEAGA